MKLIRIICLLFATLSVATAQYDLPTFRVVPDYGTGDIGEIRLLESDGYDTGAAVHYVGIRASAAMAANFTLTLPDTLPPDDLGYMLSFDENGVATWTGSGGGGGTCPTGSDNQIQFYLTGACAASPSLKFFPDVSGASELHLEDTDGAARLLVVVPSNQVGAIGVQTSGSSGWRFYRPASSTDFRLFDLSFGDRFWFTTAGRLGIGISPTEELHVSGDGLFTGNLGIGVTPTEKLDVFGSARLAGHLKFATDDAFDIGSNAARVQFGWAQAWTAGQLNIQNAARTAHFRFRYSTTSPCNINNCLELRDTSDILMMSWSQNNVNTSHRPFIPDADNTRALGTSNFQWSEVRGRRHVAGSPSSVGAYNGQIDVFNASNNSSATLTGAALDSGGAAVLTAGSLRISSPANFYNRTFSGGDISCSGITDGWTGIRLDTNEIQLCDGGAAFLVPYISLSNSPATVTLACGAGQAVKNLTVVNGIVTAASCGAP